MLCTVHAAAADTLILYWIAFPGKAPADRPTDRPTDSPVIGSENTKTMWKPYLLISKPSCSYSTPPFYFQTIPFVSKLYFFISKPCISKVYLLYPNVVLHIKPYFWYSYPNSRMQRPKWPHWPHLWISMVVGPFCHWKNNQNIGIGKNGFSSSILISESVFPIYVYDHPSNGLQL